MKRQMISSGMVMVLLMISLCMYVPCKTASASSYDAGRAIEYAHQYWQNYNPAYRNYNNAGGDCANFVSQCLYAGGLQQDDVWYNVLGM